MSSSYGTAPLALLPRGRRRTSFWTGGCETPYLSAAPEPADSAPREGAAGAPLPSDDASRGADERGPSVPRRGSSGRRPGRATRRDRAAGEPRGDRPGGPG